MKSRQSFKEKKIILDSFLHHQNTINLLFKDSFKKEILNCADLIKKTVMKKKTIFWCGNGGSAADSQHLSAELVGRYKLERKPIKSIALTTDTSVLTAISNDYNYTNVFSRQLEGVGCASDLILVISTSGNSKNIIEVLKTAKKNKIKSIALLGNKGGRCKNYADKSLIVQSTDTARIQECHILIGHIFCEILDNYFKRKK